MFHMIGGSLTTRGGASNGKNPQIKTLEIDLETLLPLDVSSYYYNVTQANIEDAPLWLLSHSYVETF